MLLRRDLKFDAAHNLTRYHGKCERLHGHTYRMIVELRGEPDDEGMIVDFVELKRAVRERVVDVLDHSYINDILPTPTAENIARFAFEQLHDPLRGELHELSSVTIYETADSSAVFTADDYRLTRPIKAAIFDFDMTLADTCSTIKECVDLFAQEQGLPPVSHSTVLSAIGLAINDMWIRFWGRLDPNWTDIYRERFAARERERFSPFPSARDALTALRDAGIRTAVVTNRTNAPLAVHCAGIDDLFETAIGLDDLNEPKPRPGMIALALSRLGVRADEAVYCGDTDIDMMTATRAGVRGVGMTTGCFSARELRGAGASYIAGDLMELPRIARRCAPLEVLPFSSHAGEL